MLQCNVCNLIHLQLNKTFNSYYLEMKPTLYKIGEWERKLLSKDMQEIILAYQEENKRLEEENKKLKEERDFFKEQAILWRNDYKNEYKKNRKLKSDLWTVIDERDNAFKKIKQLEERLDNKEKVNKSMRNEIRNLKEELGKITVHSNMLESENILLKKECKARLEKIKELEK